MYKVEMIIKFNLRENAEKYRSKMIKDFQPEIKKGIVEVYLTKEGMKQ